MTPLPDDDGVGVALGPLDQPGRTSGRARGRATSSGTATSTATTAAVPGGAVLPTAAVTRVGVRPDHTRRGMLTEMMRPSSASSPAAGAARASARHRGADLRPVRLRGRDALPDASRCAAAEPPLRPARRPAGRCGLLARRRSAATDGGVHDRIALTGRGDHRAATTWWQRPADAWPANGDHIRWPPCTPGRTETTASWSGRQRRRARPLPRLQVERPARRSPAPPRAVALPAQPRPDRRGRARRAGRSTSRSTCCRPTPRRAAWARRRTTRRAAAGRRPEAALTARRGVARRGARVVLGVHDGSCRPTRGRTGSAGARARRARWTPIPSWSATSRRSSMAYLGEPAPVECWRRPAGRPCATRRRWPRADRRSARGRAVVRHVF